MGSISSRRVAVALAAAVLAVLPAGAAGMSKDYSLNGATGDYSAQKAHKNYAMNGASGDFAPATKVAQPSIRIVRVQENSGFAWGDAGVGMGAALLVLLGGMATGRRIRRRRPSAPSSARPSAA
jgi:hypothetical protein